MDNIRLCWAIHNLFTTTFTTALVSMLTNNSTVMTKLSAVIYINPITKLQLFLLFM